MTKDYNGTERKPIPDDYDWDKFGNQLHIGNRSKDNQSIWHTDGKGLWWSGDWSHRTKEELMAQCKSTIAHLIEYYPELGDG